LLLKCVTNLQLVKKKKDNFKFLPKNKYVTTKMQKKTENTFCRSVPHIILHSETLYMLSIKEVPHSEGTAFPHRKEEEKEREKEHVY
jgi:hypothetical protein